MSERVSRIAGAGFDHVELTPELLSAPIAATQTREFSEKVAHALANPIGLPGLAQCVTPDDRIAIAVAPGAYAAPIVAEAIAVELAKAGIETKQITVVVASKNDLMRFEEFEGSELRVELHDPDDDDMLCFAGMTRVQRALMLNRELFDADMVLPVTSVGAAAIDDGPYGQAYPAFFDRKAIQRTQRVGALAATLESENRQGARRKEAEEAGWMLGVPMGVYVIPDWCGGFEGVVVGDPVTAYEQAKSAYTERQQSPQEPSELVVAMLSGSVYEQTWDALADALEAIEPLRAPGGAVAVWSEIEQPMAEAARRWMNNDTGKDVPPEFLDESGPDAWIAWRLISAIKKGPTFLRTRLTTDEIENLGVTPLESADELIHLAGRSASCVLVEGAQHASFAAEVGAPLSDEGGQ